MKSLLYISVLLLLTSCLGTGNDDKKDNPPVVSSPLENVSVEVNSPAKNIDIKGVFTDVDGDGLTYSSTSENTDIVTASLQGTLLTLQFVQDKTGTTKINIVATANNASVAHSFSVTVTEKSDHAPIVSSPISDITIVENANDTSINIADVFSDEDRDTFTYKVTSDNENLVTAAIESTTLILSYAENSVGTANINLVGVANNIEVTTTFKVTIIETPDSAPIVANPIDKVDVEFGEISHHIDIGAVFSDSDNDAFSYEITKNSNATLITAVLNGTTIGLTFGIDTVGSAEITLQATANGLTVEDVFTVSLKSNETFVVLKQSFEQYGSGNYQAAEEAFNVLQNSANEEIKATGYLGLAYTQLKLDKHADAYQNFKHESSYFVNDFKSGLSFLEYSFVGEYQKSIDLAQSVLNSDSKYVLFFDKKINYNDLLLTQALSHFELGSFANSLAQVKIIDSSVTINENDPNLSILLLNILNTLSARLKFE